VARFSESSPKEFSGNFPSNVLFVSFNDPDNDSPCSGGENYVEELRCPHFRNKCGIKRLV